MSKRKSKKCSKVADNNVTNINVEIDYDKLAKAIVLAQEERERKKEEKEQIEYEKLRQRKKEILHEKDFSYIKCRLVRKVRTELNAGCMVLKLLFISKKNARYFSGITPLIKILLISLLGIIKLGFYFIVVACIYGACKTFGTINMMTFIILALCFFMLARMVRIAGFEIDNMKDEVALMNTTTLVMTVFSVIFAAVSAIAAIMSRG